MSPTPIKGKSKHVFPVGTTHGGITVLSDRKWADAKEDGRVRTAHYEVRYACGHEGTIGHKSLVDRVTNRRSDGNGLCRDCSLHSRKATTLETTLLRVGMVMYDVTITEGPYWDDEAKNDDPDYARYDVRYSVCGHEDSLSHRVTLRRQNVLREPEYVGLCQRCTGAKREALKRDKDYQANKNKHDPLALPAEREYRVLELAHLAWNGDAIAADKLREKRA